MKMKKNMAAIFAVSLLLVILTITISMATYVVPEINNQIIISGREDVDLRNVRYIEVNPKLLHEVLIPFSKDGLGGADEYLGEVFLGMPVQGGAHTPGGVYIDSVNKVIAICDNGAIIRLYDFAGNPLGTRDGTPFGFISDGSLVAWIGLELRLYDRNGQIMWRREPFEEVKRRFWTDRSLEALNALIGGTIRISPDGDIYVPFFIQLGRRVPNPMENSPFPHLLPESSPTMDEVVSEVDGTLVYDRHGELIDIKSGSWSMVFTPTGDAFTTSVPYGDGVAHREFDLRQTKRASDGLSTPAASRRSIILRSTWMLMAISNDFSILCSQSSMRYGDTMRPYAVYRLNRDRAIIFSLPWTQVINLTNGTDGNRQFYTSELERKGVRIRTYEWPKP